jgi:hypothetical protein
MYCCNCGAPISDESIFCPECGVKVETQENVTVLTNEASSSSSQQAPKSSFKLKKISPKLMGIALVVVVIGYFTFGWIKNSIIRSNPVNLSLYGLGNIINSKSIDSYTDIKFKLNTTNNLGESELKVKETFENLTLRLETKNNKASNQSQVNANIMYKGQTLFTGEVYTDKESIYVSLPEIYGKTIKLSYKDLNKLTSNSEDKDSFDYEKYSSVYNLKDSKKFNAIQKDYSNFLKLNLTKNYTKAGKSIVLVEEENKNKTYNCTELILNMDSTQLVSLLDNFLSKVSQDKNIKTFIKDKVNECFVIAEKNGDLDKVFNMEKADIATFNKDYDKSWQDGMKDFKLTESNKQTINSINPKLNYSLKFDSKNIIRQATVNMNFNTNEYEGALSEDNINVDVTADTYYRSLNENILFKKPSESNIIDLANINDEDKNDIMYEIQNNIENLLSSKLDLY